MRHLLAIALLFAVIGVTMAGTQALRPGADLRVLLIPARTFDWPLCG